MKQINLFKKLLFVMLLVAAGTVTGQIHPLAFGSYTLLSGGTAPNNWYANYVGLRVQVTSPAVIAGDKAYTTANDGLGTATDWGGVVTTPIVNVPIYMDSTADSSGCSAFTGAAAATLNGKVAVIWRGPIGAPCDFGCKALNAQNGGAVAIILINEYPGMGPIGMAASTTCTGITIPVFMIGNADGIAISGQYRSGVPVTVTISPWGEALANDLGFVPAGAAGWHNFAIPYNQLTGGTTNSAYKQLDGAFIANYGTNDQSNVQLTSTLSWTPNGGSTSVQHTDQVNLTSFPVSDSIWAMFSGSSAPEYDIVADGQGRFDLKYVISSSVTDDNPADNTLTTSFYVTDSIYSKGRYDFTRKAPLRTLYEGTSSGSEFLWGPMYYVANGGTNMLGVQYSIASNTAGPLSGDAFGGNNVYIWKWTDGALSGTADSLLQDGELQLVGLARKNYDGFLDTSEALLYALATQDTTGSGSGLQVQLLANSWYLISVDVPASSSTPLFLGCDGVMDPFPRVFGRYNISNGLLDYSNVNLITTHDSVNTFYQNQANSPIPYVAANFVNAVDSFNYNSMRGLIPAVAMISNNNPTKSATVPGKPLANVNLFPIPAKDLLNVSVAFDKAEPVVSYTIIDGLARFVSKEVHNNVENETYTVNTSKLAAGNYYLIINAEGKVMSKKFVVVK